MRRRRVLGVAAALAVSVGAVGCASGPTAEGGFVRGDGALTRVPPEQRRPAPRLSGDLLDGGTFDSAALAGTVVVYNVWGSWCAPCRKEAPALVAAAEATRGTAVFVGINTRDLDRAPAQAFVRAFDVSYDNVYDPDGRILLAFAGHLPASAIPSTLVVDAQGRVAARILGETTEATLTGLVDDVARGA